MITDWDDAYDNSGLETDAPAIFADWGRRAADFRTRADASLDIAYGPHARERLDIFAPDGPPRGLIVFIHGGYWKAMGREGSSWIAEGPTRRGWAVAIPSYPLAPEARIATIARSVAAALAVAAERVAGPVVLTGHSAGGHLAARLMCDDGLIPDGLAARVGRVVSISGVHDLRPLLRTRMNDVLRLTATEAAAESPALLRPREGLRLSAWVGADERPEFVRQAALLANIWTGLGARCTMTAAPGQRHFSILDGLADPVSPITAALVGG
ncbi:MAG: alpha/beta hydrolase [Rubrimonas sp.]